MNLPVSIFGGMLLTVLLYALGRGLRLANFWSAVMAAGVPGGLYLFYAALSRPGLDVITMHVVAYPTVAVMLGLLYGDKARAMGGGHWAPRVMVLFFLLITLLFGGFVYVARQGLPAGLAALLLPNAGRGGVHTGFAGVVAHGGDAAKGIAQHRAMENKLARLGWTVEVVGLDALRPAHVNEVRVLVRDRTGALVPDIRVHLALGRPGQTPRESVLLEPQGEAGYLAFVGLPGEGAWLAELSLEGRGERVELQHIVGGEGPL
ncbi:MAG TPA: FixH family protein [Thiobacillaceae bacterium]|nr:FixH family protein [Thiobacillaceae bacterium]HNU64385.1 FixH family protein [Thiobacillaceae bacterium]